MDAGFPHHEREAGRLEVPPVRRAAAGLPRQGPGIGTTPRAQMMKSTMNQTVVVRIPVKLNAETGVANTDSVGA